MGGILDFLNENVGAVTTVSIVVGAVFGLFKFREYLSDRRFNTYHRLIKELVDGETPDAVLRLDRQIAIIFELRNFPEYYEVSRRILGGLRDGGWNEYSPRLGTEITLTLEYMKKWWHQKFF